MRLIFKIAIPTLVTPDGCSRREQVKSPLCSAAKQGSLLYRYHIAKADTEGHAKEIVDNLNRYRINIEAVKGERIPNSIRGAIFIAERDDIYLHIL